MKADRLTLVVFPSELGWFALAGTDRTLHRLTLGHASRVEALAQAPGLPSAALRGGHWLGRLAARLESYARGVPEDFGDVPLEPQASTAFSRRVLEACRSIRYGQVLSYAGLAAQAGSPGAARAVGNVMAANRYPLIVPCHRVVGTGGKLGGFSAPQGIALKQRLLEMESAGARWGAAARA